MAGTIVETRDLFNKGQGKVLDKLFVLLECTGDAADGTVPNKVLTGLNGWFIYSIAAWPKSGGTAPTNSSDVVLNDEHGEDLLGGNGTDLISATVKKTALPKATFAGTNLFHLIPSAMGSFTGDLTLVQTNQAVHSAQWYILLAFTR